MQTAGLIRVSKGGVSRLPQNDDDRGTGETGQGQPMRELGPTSPPSSMIRPLSTSKNQGMEAPVGASESRACHALCVLHHAKGRYSIQECGSMASSFSIMTAHVQ